MGEQEMSPKVGYFKLHKILGNLLANLPANSYSNQSFFKALVNQQGRYIPFPKR